MRLRKFYSTIVLSDIHLGTSHSKTVEVSNFLKSVNCKRLILNGDTLSQAIKQKVKSAVSYVSDFENGNWDIFLFDEMLIGEHITDISIAS